MVCIREDGREKSIDDGLPIPADESELPWIQFISVLIEKTVGGCGKSVAIASRSLVNSIERIPPLPSPFHLAGNQRPVVFNRRAFTN